MTIYAFASKTETFGIFLWMHLVKYGLLLKSQVETHLPAQPEVVGSIEEGIKAAEWSPDEELLTLITGEASRGHPFCIPNTYVRSGSTLVDDQGL
jgi:hypothetical protein